MNELQSTTMRGASMIMQAQAVNANNLANAATDGFRAEIAHVIAGQLEQGITGAPDFSLGPVRTTGRDLDVSIDGVGWIAVVTPEGTEGYTRRGDLHVDALGQLRNGAGLQVLGNGGPIALPPFEALEIAPDGTVSLRPLGQTPDTLAVMDRIKLVLPDESQLRRGPDGLMRLPDGQDAAPDAGVKLVSGTLEGSNVNAVDAMVTMIDLARQFEAQIQLMRASQENETALNQLLRIN